MARPSRFFRGLFIATTLGLAAGCGGDDGPTGLDPNVFEVAIVSGGGQSGIAGTVLDEPLVVLVRRKDTGAPEDGATVRWRVVSGTGEPTRTSTATDESGRGVTRVVLGNLPGEVVLQAEVVGLNPVTFEAIDVLPAPAILSVSPTQADPGDTVAVTVSNLPAALAAKVLFDGVAGVVVNRVDGAQAVLSTVVPAPIGVCSPGSEVVDVRLRAGGLTTGPVALTVSVPADPFQVGQVLVIEGTTDVQCALLPADGGNAKYLLVALSAEFEQSGNFQVTLGANSVAFAAAAASPPTDHVTFHNQLRAFEQRIAERGLPLARAPERDVQLFAGPQVGDTRQFWVLNDPNATEDGLTEDEFDRVTATLKFVGANTLLYLDNASPSAGLTDAELQSLGEIYDRRLYNVDVDFFGEPTDVDDNEQVIVLLSPTVNSLTSRGSEGVIVGFFFGFDLLEPNGCSDCRFSNGAELFYGLVPDADGEFSDPRSRDRVLELLPGVMVHETQHMIGLRYKVFENLSTTLETLWLSEGLAHTAEELSGDAADAAGETSLANDLYASNFGRAARYLSEPEAASLTSSDGSGSLGERGGWWLLLRWVGDQYGDFIFRDLTQAAPNGVANLEAQTGEDFFRLFADFSVAAWADDLEIPGIAERYQIPKWLLRSILTENGDGGAYLLQPTQRTFSTFRSNSITEFLAGSSAFYVELDAAGDTQDLQLELMSAVADAGLAILRYE